MSFDAVTIRNAGPMRDPVRDPVRQSDGHPVDHKFAHGYDRRRTTTTAKHRTIVTLLQALLQSLVYLGKSFPRLSS